MELCCSLSRWPWSVRASGLMNWKVTRLTYLYNHINYVRLCWRPRGPPQSELWTAAGQVRQPWLAVVAIETMICVCAGPRHALQTGPAWSQGSRPDMTPVRASFHLGRRDDRGGPGLLPALRWNAPQRYSRRKRSGIVTVRKPAVEMSLFCAEYLKT